MSTKRDSGDSSLSPSSPKRARYDFDGSEIYLLYYIYPGPARYKMYKLDTSAIGNDNNKVNDSGDDHYDGYDSSDDSGDDSGDDHNNGYDSSMIPNLTPVFELSSKTYPRNMGSFALGSRIYLLGGEVDFITPPGRNTRCLSEKVYFFDTAAAALSSSSSSSPLSVAPPMRGGKTSPRAITVDGKIYVISDLPTPDIYYTEKDPLFEVFNPQGDEGKGNWSSLPAPPFYNPTHVGWDVEFYGLGSIVSHVVIDAKIYFFITTNAQAQVYFFDVCRSRWQRLEVYGCNGTDFPFEGAVLPIFDSVWAAMASGIFHTSPIKTFELMALGGLVGREVEGLENHTIFNLKPPLLYGMYDRLLDMGNGWVCRLKFGNDKKLYRTGCKTYVSATVFRLVKKRMDNVTFGELGKTEWLYTPPPDFRNHDRSEVAGEIQVFGAEGIRSSLFSPGLENSHYGPWLCDAIGCFLIKKHAHSNYPVGLGK